MNRILTSTPRFAVHCCYLLAPQMYLLLSLVTLFLLTGCEKPGPTLPVETEVFASDVYPVAYRVNFFETDPQGVMHAGAGNTLFRIIRDGEQAEPFFRFENDIRAIHFTPSGVLFVATDDDHWDETKPSRVYRSTNSGQSFEQVLEIAGGSALWWSIASDARDNIFIGEYGPDEPGLSKTVWRSSDLGDNWQAVFNAPDIDKVHIHRVAVDPYTDQVWVTIGDGKNRGAYHSANGGRDWAMKLDSQATAVVFTKDAIYWGEDRKSDSGITRVDRNTGTPTQVLNVETHGNYGGSVYDMTAGKTGTLYAPFMKYPDQDHVASIWIGDGANWQLLMNLDSRESIGGGKETIGGPDRDGWVYITGYKIRDRTFDKFANPESITDNAD